MPVFPLHKELKFPPPRLAEPDGLLAIGGDLSPERLLLAYSMGIFPWYDDEPILWWSPDPRFVLFPSELHISRSMTALLRKNEFSFSINKAFPRVIRHCKEIHRPGQEGTWINQEIVDAYTRLHALGFAHSAEVWKNGELAGGLYGIKLGWVFFGESMFSLQPNASKIALVKYAGELEKEGVSLIDCQVYTKHLESLGARMIPGEQFRKLLESGDRQFNNRDVPGPAC